MATKKATASKEAPTVADLEKARALLKENNIENPVATPEGFKPGLFGTDEYIMQVEIIHGEPTLITSHGLYTMYPKPGRRGFELRPVNLWRQRPI